MLGRGCSQLYLRALRNRVSRYRADLLERMLAARDYQSAMQMVRQLEFSLFDFLLHSEKGSEVDVQATLDKVREEVAVVIPPSFNRFQNNFGHIFAGWLRCGLLQLQMGLRYFLLTLIASLRKTVFLTAKQAKRS